MTSNADEIKRDVDLEDDFDLASLEEREKKVTWYDNIILNRPLRVILVLIITAIGAPILIYQFIFFSYTHLPPLDGFSLGSCVIPRTARIPCGIGVMSADQCHPQCCYDFNNGICFHRLPSRFSYILEGNWTEDSVLRPRIDTVPFDFQNSLNNIKMSIDEVSSTHMTMTFYDANEKSLNGTRIENKNYTYEIVTPELDIEVTGPEGVIFSTIRGPLIASKNIWEMAFKLTEESMYGLGEIPLQRETTKVIYNHKEGFSSIPLVFAKSNGSYHGLLFDIDTPTEVSVDASNQILVRSITSSGLKLHLFVGPQPKDISREVVKFIGYDKEILEYWMLGAHICSENSDAVESRAFETLNMFINNATENKLPYESHCGTLPIVFDTSCQSETISYVEKGAELLKTAKKRFMPHVSPYIRYPENSRSSAKHIKTAKSNSYCSNNIIPDFENIMLHRPNSSIIYNGSADGHSVIYPDYGSATEEFMIRLWQYKIEFDGVILENNWPLDESFSYVNETYFYLPYFSNNLETAFNHTPQWNISRRDDEIYINIHNKYGNNFVNAMKKLSVNTPTLSTSQWMKGDVIINRQTIHTSWTNFRKELIAAALGGISGHQLWTSPICGDTDNFDPNTHISLCVKWYMAATYLPMIKIHSKNVQRDPLAFIGTHRVHMVTALNNRLSLLPYFYTTLQYGPLLRPMFYQYPSMEQLSDLITQYNVGDDLLIVPNLQPLQSHVHILMPPGRWFELWSGLNIPGEEGKTVTMTTTDADFLTLVRGGSIIIMQKDVRETADETRLHSNFSLTIAMVCETFNSTNPIFPGLVTECEATGELYMTQNMTLDFDASFEKINVRARGDDYRSFCSADAIWANTISEIKIYGLNENLNNYDFHKHIRATINLCELETKNEISFDFNNI